MRQTACWEDYTSPCQLVALIVLCSQMKITRITVWQVPLPLKQPYQLSGGRLKVEHLDSTFVRVDTGEGLCGWGEGCPWGHAYLPAHGPGVRAGISTLAPALVGCDPCAVDEVNRVMDRALPGHQYVKSALDIACWDILGQAAGMPLWRLLGGARAEAVMLNSSIPTAAPEVMVESIKTARAAGYRVHSAKIGGTDPAVDIARINAITDALSAGESVTFDANRAWTPGIAVQVLGSVAARGWIEQPCETITQCAQVAARVCQPVMLDECLHSFDDHLQAWRLRACEGVKVKPNRLGGLTRARQVRDFGISIGWQMHVEDTGGSALADTAALHLAASTPAGQRLATWLSHPHLAVDPVPGQGARNAGGFASPPTVPGLGVSPSPDALGAPAAVYGDAT